MTFYRSSILVCACALALSLPAACGGSPEPTEHTEQSSEAYTATCTTYCVQTCWATYDFQPSALPGCQDLCCNGGGGGGGHHPYQPHGKEIDPRPEELK
jgi:hypothetical protein